MELSLKRPAATADFIIPRKKPRVVEPEKKKIRVLVLFSGTKSVTRALDKYFPNEYEVVSVDLDPTHKPTHNVNILTWDYEKIYQPGDFEYVWASCPCEQYSICKSSGERNLKLANSLVYKTLQIIDYIKPRAWFIENPATGLLCRDIKPYKKQTILDGLDYVDIDYCQYSAEGDEFPYRKRTRIWSNALRHFRPLLCLGKGSCKMIKPDSAKHYVNFGNFRECPTHYKGIKVDLDFKHRVPMLLIKKLFLAAEKM